jgi:hypothetical protein
MELILIAIIIYLGVKEYLTHVERKDMLDRLMAKNLPEYKDNSQPEENEYPEEDKNLIDLDDAREELENG